MNTFARLYAELDSANATNDKLAAIRRYLADSAPEEAGWGLYFLSGRKRSRIVAAPRLREWTAEALSLPAFVIEESYAHVGDLAETLALLWDRPPVDDAVHPPAPLLSELVAQLDALRSADESVQRRALLTWWSELPLLERFMLNKLVTGSLRVGVSSGLVTRAVAAHAGLPEAVVAQRLMGNWEPSADWYARLMAPVADGADGSAGDPGAPYPFCLAAPIPTDVGDMAAAVGAADDYLIEWKWDGIRAQIVRRAGQTFIWSRGEELMNGRFPEVEAVAAGFPDGTVIDGEILAWKDDGVAPFALLQRRIGRKIVGAKLLAAAPVAFLAYDLLETDHLDRRAEPLRQRRMRLEALAAAHPALRLSPQVTASDWAALAALREDARERRVEGLMLKRLESPYLVGRKRGAWWKWKVGALTVDTVLIYAQAGHGRRSNLYTDYTLAVWDDDRLVPVTKAYSGLDDRELAAMDRWIRAHTLEKFGPVRSVEPLQVFEIAFEGIAASPRHKSGVALRFPRILRWRQDKLPRDADTLDSLARLIEPVTM